MTRFSFPSESPYAIAELGFNHGGSLTRARRLIEAAAGAEADGVSVPLYRTDHLLSGVYCEDEVSIYRSHQLSREDVIELAGVAEECGVEFAATVYDPELLEWYRTELAPPFVGIHAGDLTYRRLLEACARGTEPILLSTAAATMDEIETALHWLENAEVVLFHSTADRPTPDDRLHLRRIRSLRERFGDPVGYADRSQSTEAPLIAGRLGATVWMRPLTLDSDQESPHQPVSLEPDRFKEVVDRFQPIRENDPETIEADPDRMLGDPDPEQSEVDRDFRTRYRRSLMADRTLAAGDRLKADMVRELRPGNGLPAGRIEDCLGMMVQRPTDPLHMISY